MSMFYKICFAVCCVTLFFSTIATSAQDKEIELVLDSKNIPISGSIRLDMIFPDTQGMSAPELAEIDGLKITYLRSTNAASRASGMLKYATKHTYVITPQQVGVFSIGPFSVNYNGVDYISGKADIRVGSRILGVSPHKDENVNDEEARARDDIFLLMATDKKKVYINQVFHIVVGLYYRDISITDIQYPLLAHEGFSMDEFHAPQKSRKTIKGYNYNIITFRSSLFPLLSGDLKLGPATIAFNSQSQSPIDSPGLGEKASKKHSLKLKSTIKEIAVLPVPDDARPENFNGAIGNFDFNISIEPKGPVKVGDAIVITMEISGNGNLALLSAPGIDQSEDYILYESYLKDEGKARKVFEQTLIPKSSALQSIPPVKFSFFDPEEERFKVIAKGPIEVQIIEAGEEEKSRIMEDADNMNSDYDQPLLSKGIVYIKDFPGRFKRKGSYLHNNKKFLISQSIPLFLYVSLLLIYKRRERFQNDIRYARIKIADKQARSALKKARSLLNDSSVEEFYVAIFECLQEYFGNKFNLPSAGITSDIVEHVLRPKDFDQNIIIKVSSFFNDCDIAKFTPYRYKEKDMLRSFNQAKEIISYFKKA